MASGADCTTPEDLAGVWACAEPTKARAAQRRMRLREAERTGALAMPRDGVDEGRAALLHLGDGALESRLHILRVLDRPFRPHAHGAGHGGEVGRRVVKVHA